MMKTINFRKQLIQTLANDKEEALGYLQTAIEAYRDNEKCLNSPQRGDYKHIAVFRIALTTFIASQERNAHDDKL